MTRDVVQLEKDGWIALSSSAQEVRTFFGRVLDQRVVMVLPGGIVLDDRAGILESMSGEPWSSYDLEELVMLEPTDDVAVVIYRVAARRDGHPDYRAIVSSTYARREDGWKLALHQQTPW